MMGLTRASRARKWQQAVERRGLMLRKPAVKSVVAPAGFELAFLALRGLKPRPAPASSGVLVLRAKEGKMIVEKMDRAIRIRYAGVRPRALTVGTI